MGRPKQTQLLKVYINNIYIGELTRSSGREISFQYALSWLMHDKARPISLQFPLRKRSYKGAKVEYYFDNLLPDNDEIRRRIHNRVGSNSIHSFDLLSAIGKDCIGALQFAPEEITLAQSTIKACRLTRSQIAKTLRNYQTNPLGMNQDNDFRISLAGAQEKTAFLKYQGHWCRPEGTTATTHIFKLPIGLIQNNALDLSDSVENEWLCHLILKEFGLDVANAEIQTFDKLKVLIVERFDRVWDKSNKNIIRLPQEDMCQALGYPSGRKYQTDGGPGIKDIMQLLLGSENKSDRELFFKTQIIYWLLAAPDGHAKNFSLFLNPKGRYRLTPLYDILSVFPNITPKPTTTKAGRTINRRDTQPQKVKMAMALVSKNRHYHWTHMSYRYFISSAKACGFSEGKTRHTIEELIDTSPAVINAINEKIPPNFPQHISHSILNGLAQSVEKLKRNSA